LGEILLAYTRLSSVFLQFTKAMKTLVGELNNFHLYWTSPTDPLKGKVKTHVKDMFSKKAKLLTTLGHRSLRQPSIVDDTQWPIIGLQLGFHAYGVRKAKQNKNDWILRGGKYNPCHELTDDIRDTIYFKQDDCLHPVKAEHFSDLSLNSDSELLNPQVLATAIYTDKSITDEEREQVRRLRSQFQSWRSSQNKKNPAYVKIIHLKENDACGGGGGGGGRGKRITKGELIKPIEEGAVQFAEIY